MFLQGPDDGGNRQKAYEELEVAFPLAVELWVDHDLVGPGVGRAVSVKNAEELCLPSRRVQGLGVDPLTSVYVAQLLQAVDEERL